MLVWEAKDKEFLIKNISEITKGSKFAIMIFYFNKILSYYLFVSQLVSSIVLTVLYMTCFAKVQK